MFRFIESFISELTHVMSINSRRIIVGILALATLSTTITMKSINIYFIAAFLFVSISLYLPEIYKFLMNKVN
ncbi:hypothetical protein [Providencia manganoxydans]|uniref:hypothetical protein n=1 Tax=Providencia manganoxydans TaxID=2923283 RepID=UPI00280D9F41|nr:hypothetical protein [Providencia stuartii]ELR5083682.1 hypothetical protein [Providencia stuartii]